MFKARTLYFQLFICLWLLLFLMLRQITKSEQFTLGFNLTTDSLYLLEYDCIFEK